MKEFNYIIIGGGCAGLSLAYELDIHEKLKDKTLAIIEPRSEYKKDKTWSFWKVTPHNFDDCIKKSWENFSINIPGKTNFLECKNYPYQSIDSGLFYEKINNKLRENKNITFFKDITEINKKNVLITIESSETHRPLLPPLTLIQALPKMAHLELILQKGTELGVSHFYLYRSALSEQKELSEIQKKRLQRILISAMKQCGRPRGMSPLGHFSQAHL